MSGILCSGDMIFFPFNSDGVTYNNGISFGNTEKFEIKEDATIENRISSGSTNYGTAIDSVTIPKPNEVTISTDEFDSGVCSVLMRGVVTDTSIGAHTATADDLTAVLGRWKTLTYGNIVAASPVVVDTDFTPAAWSHAAKAVGVLIAPTTPNSHYYIVVKAGTTGTTEPTTWPTNGGQIVDGTVIWQDRGTSILVEGLDYKINYNIGLFCPMAGGLITADDAITVTYDSAASSGTVVTGNALPPMRGKAVLDGVNRANGHQITVIVPNITLSAAGSIDFKTKKFTAVPMKGTAIFNAAIGGAYQIIDKTSSSVMGG